MARLYRPHVPLKVRCEVAERQLRQLGALPDLVARGTQSHRLLLLMDALAGAIGCERQELRLDHDPPLAARPRHRRGLNPRTFYTPEANDPHHLCYRPHGPQHEHSHLIKTNVRGDHGQHPDRVLIKKARRAERLPTPKRGPPIRSRGFTKSTDKLTEKMKWPKRPFPKRRRS
jgi:hypothetical protein